jgi:hypothetical protein
MGDGSELTLHGKRAFFIYRRRKAHASHISGTHVILWFPDFTKPQLLHFNPDFALGIPEIIGGRVKRVKK